MRHQKERAITIVETSRSSDTRFTEACRAPEPMTKKTRPADAGRAFGRLSDVADQKLNLVRIPTVRSSRSDTRTAEL